MFLNNSKIFLKVVIGDIHGRLKISNQNDSYSSSFTLINSFQGHSTYINRIKQSPFNNSNIIATCSHDQTVKIWHVYSSSNWTLIRTYSNHSSYVWTLEWLDADTLASSGYQDKTIKIWSLSSGYTKRVINTGAYVLSLKLLNGSNDGSPSSTSFYLAVGLNASINIYNINDGSLVSTLNGHTDYVRDLVQISNDLLASSSGDRTVRLWNLATNTCTFIPRGHTSSVYGLKQINSQILASGSHDATIKLWNTTSGQLIRTLTGHTNEVLWSIDLINDNISSQSTTLVSGSGDQTVRKWNWQTGELLSTIQVPNSYIYSLAVIFMNQNQQTTTSTPTTGKFYSHACFLLSS